MDSKQEDTNYEDLLNYLKSTVENILKCHPPNVWNIFGSNQRLQVAVTKILKHGFKFLKDNGEPDFWVFVQGLCWLQPTLAASPLFLGNPSVSVRSPLKKTDKAIAWLHKSIENHTFSEKLSWLLSDQEHLFSCYKSKAYLRQVQYSEAMLICLKAVEQGEISLLAKIDPTLYLKKKNVTTRKHLSYAESKSNDSEKNGTSILSTCSGTSSTDIIDNNWSLEYNEIKITKRPQVINSIFECTDSEKIMKDFIKNNLLKKSNSTSDLYLLYYKEKNNFLFSKNVKKFHSRNCSLSGSVNHSPIENNQSRIKYDKSESDVKNRQSACFIHQHNDSLDSLSNISATDTVINMGNIKKPKRRRRSSFFKLPFRIWDTTSDDEQNNFSDSSSDQTSITGMNNKKSFIENDGHIMLPMSTGSFPKPAPGQSIISFLSSGVFTQTNAELDRENAHFNIAEALVTVLKQAKCNQQSNFNEEIIEESDDEINNLKHFIQVRRRQKQNEKSFKESNECFSTDSNTLSTDHNSLTSSMCSTSDSIFTEQDEKESLSFSKLPLTCDYTDEFDINNGNAASAENLAISLLQKFNENQLPTASEIEWLISEQDVPQQIIPFPYDNSSREDTNKEELGKQTLLRGTFEWAPPRPQIIFTLHPSSRRQLMEKQNYRCAGCGIEVAQKYASKFRYCEYLGRYFCTVCHSRRSSTIPSRVLTKWDFSKYSVSDFSYRLLDQLSTDPLFNVMDLNPSLYRRARDLQKIRLLRVALFYLKDFIFTCRYAEKLQNVIKLEQNHIYTDPDCYSLKDFINVKNNRLYKKLSEIVKHCEDHVNNCELCRAQGFICEICRKQDIIFPWELYSVMRCSKCYSCYHIKCHEKKPVCPKCTRINNRNDSNKN
ncbi:hypothetical protein PGB90_003632 [Kerria lacca]